ncbi:MAG: competence/damage-inducible protein A [Candidatus Bathyarchaeota archaeon]
MKNCGIIIVGNEILQGYVQDTNSRWIARKLTDLGYNVKIMLVVGDVIEDIGEALTLTFKLNLDFVFVCGGLGPTPDDKTVEAVAKHFNIKLTQNKNVLDEISRKISFLKGKGIVDINQSKWITKMTYIPEGSIPLKNSLGLAPGILLQFKGKNIFMLPGVPVEMKTIFAEEVEPRIGVGERRVVKEIVLKSEESKFSDIVEKLENKYRKICIGMYPHYGKMELIIRIVGNEVEVLSAIEEIKKESEKLGVEILKLT